MTDETDAPGQPATPRGFGKRRRGPGFITQAARDSLSVSRAFGPAYERDGVHVIPVARVMGGTSSAYGGGALAAGPGGSAGSGGSEQSPHDAAAASGPRHVGIDASGNGDGYAGGGGFGAAIKPLGVVVIDDSGTHWQPTIDINRAILGGQIIAALAVLTAGRILARRNTTVHRLGLPALPAFPAVPRLLHRHHRVGKG